MFKKFKAPKGEMTFLEHLEEFRWRVIYSIIGIVVGTIIAWIFINPLVDVILLRPARMEHIQLQNLRPFGQLFVFVEIAIITGFVVSIPNFFYQTWKFIAPALKEKEKDFITFIVVFSSICFFVGVVFAYFIMLPLMLKFAEQFGSKIIENKFAIDEYFSIILSVMIGSGIVFELPVLSFLLSKLGILKPQLMRKYRRHSIVVILFLAAILTPGTDPVSQIALSIPLLLLYEISIFVSKFAQKKVAKD